ncbi:MAG: chemotaxis protein CheA [Myxococcales bacterium]
MRGGGVLTPSRPPSSGPAPTGHLRERLDELAAAVVLAEAEPQVLQRLADLTAAVLALAGPGSGLPLSDLQHVEALLRRAAGAKADPGLALTAASDLVTRLQEQLAHPGRPPAPAEPAPAEPTATAPVQAPGAPRLVRRDQDVVELMGDFVQEASEGLSHADELLVAAEHGGLEDESLHDLFRIFHSIKGLAGHLKEASQVGVLSHAVESLLDLVRSKQLAPDAEVLDLVFEATAGLRRLLTGLKAAFDAQLPVPADAAMPALVERLAAASASPADRPAPAPGPAPSPSAPAPSPGPARGAAAPAPAVALGETLRVDRGRVDAIVEAIGELLIVQSMVMHAPELKSAASPRLRDQLAQMSRLSRELQDASMQLRMVPLQAVFKSKVRLVRELARQSGKDVLLECSGGATEMDRAMVAALEEPLVHLLRNAVDHGVEVPSERERSGKPPTGVVHLRAYHQAGSVVVEVADDGRGLRREAIRARAVERGLVEPSAEPAESELLDLIFHPGFSTAERVTELSGRGVGLDVVKRSIEALRGRVVVTSQPGQGALFRLVLPLTLAIIDGMIVSSGRERYVIPSLSIVESLSLRPEMIASLAQREEFLPIRGEVLPVVRLARLLKVAEPDLTERTIAVIVESMGRKAALVVDAVLAQQQVVIKPLGPGVGHAEHFGGAAILSDGRVGLILNVDRLCSDLARRGGTRKDRNTEEERT